MPARPTGIGTARVLHAFEASADCASVVKMHWLCECGHSDMGYPGIETSCTECHRAVRIPDQPYDGNRDFIKAAILRRDERLRAATSTRRFSSPSLEEGAERPVTTARTLAAYRDELQAVGFDAEQTWTLVNIAAHDPGTLTVHPEFVERAEPVIPVRFGTSTPQDAP